MYVYSFVHILHDVLICVNGQDELEQIMYSGEKLMYEYVCKWHICEYSSKDNKLIQTK